MGLGGIMTISVFLIAWLVVQWYVVETRMDALGLMIVLFYTFLTIYLSAKQLLIAIEINNHHLEILQVFVDWQMEGAFPSEDEDNDHAEIELLARTRDIIKEEFRPVSVLGLPATPTLANVFLGYILSAILFILAPMLQ
jgi:hypothetical protein